MRVLLLRVMAPAWFLLAFCSRRKEEGLDEWTSYCASSCGWAEGAELKMCFRLKHTMTLKGLLHSCTAPMLAHVLDSAPILILNQVCFVAVGFVFSYLCPKLLGGSTCLYNCAFTKYVLLFSLYEAAVVKLRSN